jgi:putative ABC transport system permease protein
MKFSRFIFANLFRKKIRLLLTIGSFAVALFLFTFLAVVKSAFSRGTDLAGADRLVVINRAGLINTIPLAYRDGSAACIRTKRIFSPSSLSILKISARL